MHVPQISLPERFHTNADNPLQRRSAPVRRVWGRVGTTLVVLAIMGLFVHDRLSVWVQLAIGWVLFSAMLRFLGFLIGYNSVR